MGKKNSGTVKILPTSDSSDVPVVGPENSIVVDLVNGVLGANNSFVAELLKKAEAPTGATKIILKGGGHALGVFSIAWGTFVDIENGESKTQAIISNVVAGVAGVVATVAVIGSASAVATVSFPVIVAAAIIGAGASCLANKWVDDSWDEAEDAADSLLTKVGKEFSDFTLEDGLLTTKSSSLDAVHAMLTAAEAAGEKVTKVVYGDKYESFDLLDPKLIPEAIKLANLSPEAENVESIRDSLLFRQRLSANSNFLLAGKNDYITISFPPDASDPMKLAHEDFNLKGYLKDPFHPLEDSNRPSDSDGPLKPGPHSGFRSYRPDPLILDMDDDGFELIPLKDSPVMFDLDADGFRERTQWVAGDDALLALDVNGNGKIDDIRELFGDTEKFRDGLAKLASFDENGDNNIDVKDSIYSKLLLWHDSNSNGETDAGELKTLAESNIASISTKSDGNLQSTFSFKNGKQGRTWDINFESNQMDSIDTTGIPLDAEILSLPWLRGYGRVKNLAAAMKENPELKKNVKQLASEKDIEVLFSGFEQLLFTWTGAAKVGANGWSPGHGPKLAIIDAFFDYNYSTSLEFHPALYEEKFWGLCEDAFEKISWHMFSSFVLQTEFKSLFPGVSYNFAQDTFKFSKTDAEIVDSFAEKLSSYTLKEKSFLVKMLQTIDADGSIFDAMKDRISNEDYTLFKKMQSSPIVFCSRYGNTFDFRDKTAFVFGNMLNDRLLGGKDSVLLGEGGNDSLAGGDQAVLFGDEGNDQLFAAGGNVTSYGGTGNDTLTGGRDSILHGGVGSDTYKFERGKGRSVIVEEIEPNASSSSTADKDVVMFGTGIMATDLWFSRSGQSLTIGIIGSEDSIRIDDWYSDAARRVEEFSLSDGSVLLAGQVQSLVDAMSGYKPVSAGILNVPDVMHKKVQSVIATSWQKNTN